MKKTILILSVLLFISPVSFAAEQTIQNTDNQNHSFYQSIKSGWNSFLDALAGKNSRAKTISENQPQTKVQSKPNTITTGNRPSSSQSQSNDNHDSLYQSVRKGWNSFIDFLTGTK